MSNDRDQILEQRIDRELKSLPELPAPTGFSMRVLSAIRKQAELPWYKRSWQDWPQGLRFASMALVVSALAAGVFGVAQLPRLGALTSMTTGANNVFGAVQSFLNVLGALGNSLLLVLQKMGPVAIAGGVLVVLFGYITCVGLGTVYVKLALARR
jgi:hypothetical protein